MSLCQKQITHQSVIACDDRGLLYVKGENEETFQQTVMTDGIVSPYDEHRQTILKSNAKSLPHGVFPWTGPSSSTMPLVDNPEHAMSPTLSLKLSLSEEVGL